MIMEEKKPLQIPCLISGILFALCALLEFYRVFNFGVSVYTIFVFVEMAGFAIVAVGLIAKRRNILIPIGFFVIALSALVGLILSKYHYIVYDLSVFLRAAGFAFAGYLALIYLTDKLTKYRRKMCAFWFIPAIVVGVSYLQGLFGHLHLFILQIPALLLAAFWFVYPNGKEKVKAGSSNDPVSENEMYCGMAKHVLLLFFTFGVWILMWIYRVTRYTNIVKDEEERSPTTQLLLCMFVPFYQIYWTYKTAQRIDKMAMAKGMQTDMSTMCLIFAIFVPIIPPILMQDKLNNIAVAGDVKTTPVQKNQAVNNAVLGTAEELKNYKELLDQGTITQEEFDAKKKQLLGL